MKQRLLQYLVCPRCGDALSLTEAAAAEEVLTGELRCASGDHRFPITGGIPRLLPPELAQDVQRTSDNFGWQWLEFSTLHPTEDLYQSQFLDWIYPIQPDYFTDKVVLDAGCGMGRFALASAEFGAKDVLAIDVSEAVEAAYANTRHMPNVHVIQADIYNLPFKQPLDFAFSIGVLHHLPNPEGGFRALVRAPEAGRDRLRVGVRAGEQRLDSQHRESAAEQGVLAAPSHGALQLLLLGRSHGAPYPQAAVSPS